MKEQFHIVLITLGLFVSGLLMGIWTQKTRPIPPPPAQVLGEFGALPPPEIMGGGFRVGRTAGAYGPEMGGGFAIQRFSAGHPGAVVAMNRNIAEMEPKIREFQEAVDAIEKDFRAELDKVLTPDQRSKLNSMEAEEGPQTSGQIPMPPPPAQMEGHDAEGQRFIVGFHPPFPFGGWLMMSMIVYQPSLDHLTTELKLNPDQQAAVKQLMLRRRADLLALIDKSPPPTLEFSDTLP
jgi:hypothetical protein